MILTVFLRQIDLARPEFIVGPRERMIVIQAVRFAVAPLQQ
jgi:hypothetical protein